MSTKSYLKLRTIRVNPQKVGGFGRPYWSAPPASRELDRCHALNGYLQLTVVVTKAVILGLELLEAEILPRINY